jgi:palmitoyl-protein thioesterase
MNLLYPTILIHGIGGNYKDLFQLETYLQNNGVPTYNLEIGNGKIDSIFMNINTQCEVFSKQIEKQKIDGKINIIGVSQGGLLARCYVEKYSHLINPVHSLITYGTPHMGIFNEKLNLSPLEYWKNPYKYEEYLHNNDFLVFLNNEKWHDDYSIYKTNIVRLDNFLMIWSNIDTVISPKQSAKFEFYNVSNVKSNDPLEIVDFKISSTYKNDLIGLKTLDENNKLIVRQYDCKHEDFKMPSCFLDSNLSASEISLLKLTISYL